MEYKATLKPQGSADPQELSVEAENESEAEQVLEDVYGDGVLIKELTPVGELEASTTSEDSIYAVEYRIEGLQRDDEQHVEGNSPDDAIERAEHIIPDSAEILDAYEISREELEARADHGGWDGWSKGSDIADTTDADNTSDTTETSMPSNTGVGHDIDDSAEIADASNTPDAILQESAELYRSKNDDYGDAWHLAGETLALWVRQLECDFDSSDPDACASWNLYMQRLHKLLRAFNSEFTDSSINNESIVDSHQDEATYAAIHASHIHDDTDGT